MAVFTRTERAMARPTSRAAVSLAPPTTWISTSFEAPSPSATIASASVRATCSTASSNAFHTAPSRAGSPPDAPPASSSTVSLVLVSPSTEMALKLRSATRRSSGCSAAGSPAASVVSTASSVAMSGWIIPAPLAIPPTVIMPAGVSKRTAQCLGRVSVVMMARAASGPPSAVRCAAAVCRPLLICSSGRGTPITPVESTSAVRAGRPAACSAAWAMARAATSPGPPVHAFATRAFMATALMRPGRSAKRSASYVTGAARSAFLVNTPAVAQLVAHTSSATSGAPSAFSPACAAAAVKPRGDVTEPLGISVRAEDIGGKIAQARRLCNRPGRHIIAQPSREARSMSEPFLSSDDYDERAHQLYNDGQYDHAIETLREGLGRYPHAVELHVGMGYARLAREEAVGLDPEHEDALAGLGEVLLKFGDRAGAVACFDRILALGFREDHDLMLQVGRALFRAGVLDQARRFFEVAITVHPDSAEAAACVGYAAHRLSDGGGALYWLRRALELDAAHAEARIYLANLLYDRGEYEAALFHLQRTEPGDHFDGLAIWRLVELKRSVYHLPEGDPELVPWHRRLDELSADAAPEDLLLAELEAMGPDGQVRDPRQLELFGTLLTQLQGMKARSVPAEIHRVSMLNGATYVGTWEEIVRQMKNDAAEWARGSLEQYMAAVAHRGRKETGVAIPATDPESFIRGSADAGLLRILH